MIEAFKGQKEVQIIIFILGNEEYAVPIMRQAPYFYQS